MFSAIYLFCLLTLVQGSVRCHLVHHAASVLVIRGEGNYISRNNSVTQLKLKSDSTQIGLPLTGRVGTWQKLARAKNKIERISSSFLRYRYSKRGT